MGGFGTGTDHVLITLHAMGPDALAVYSERLAALFQVGNAFREIWRQDGAALMDIVDGQLVPTAKVHFGYTDGISQTTIRGGPERYPPDHQTACEPWLFVLSTDAENYFVPEPHELGLNGSFAVFKMAETNVVGFREFPAIESRRRSIPNCSPPKCAGAGATACRSCCRRTLTVPPGGITPEQLNDYEYVERRRHRRPKRHPLPDRRAHAPDQPEGTAGCGPRSPWRQ